PCPGTTRSPRSRGRATAANWRGSICGHVRRSLHRFKGRAMVGVRAPGERRRLDAVLAAWPKRQTDSRRTCRLWTSARQASQEAEQMSELWRLSATEAVDKLRRREVAPLEMVEAAARRIEAVEPHVNALPIRFLDEARELARSFRHSRDDHPGWLAGLPIAIK